MPIDVKAIEREIESGLGNERPRLDEARENFDFYGLRFAAYPVRASGDSYEQTRYKRSSALMRRVVHVLAEHLYREGPQRTVEGDDAATAWLADCYRANAADSLWQQADRLGCVGQVAAFQVVGSDDPECPVRLELWGADSFIIWADPDDCRKPVAAATIDLYDNRRRLRLYTPDEVLTYLTRKLTDGQTAGGTAYEQATREPNPYGVLPFAFAHFEEPSTDFWGGGPGHALKEANDYLNFRLTEMGDNLRYYARPLGVAEGVSAAWRPPTPLRPGQFVAVPPSGVDAAGVGPAPSLHYLQADLHAVTTEWEDLDHFIDHTLEMWGIPPATIRMAENTARSGISIVAEQIPLILWAQARQRPFGRYESDLARVTLRVAGVHLGRADLTEASGPGFTLSLRWPEMHVQVPGIEQDRADDFELSVGLISKLMLIQKRKNLTRDEAVAYLGQLAQDHADEQRILPSEAVEAPPPVEAISVRAQ